MKKIVIYLIIFILMPIIVSSKEKTISVKEMLLTGPSEIKLHSLAMITQGKINDDLDESYIDAFIVCSKEKYIPIRITTAKILGKHYVKNKDVVNIEVINILKNLARDENLDVSNAAIHEGLVFVKNKDNEIKEMLNTYIK